MVTAVVAFRQLPWCALRYPIWGKEKWLLPQAWRQDRLRSIKYTLWMVQTVRNRLAGVWGNTYLCEFRHLLICWSWKRDFMAAPLLAGIWCNWKGAISFVAVTSSEWGDQWARATNKVPSWFNDPERLTVRKHESPSYQAGLEVIRQEEEIVHISFPSRRTSRYLHKNATINEEIEGSPCPVMGLLWVQLSWLNKAAKTTWSYTL